MKNVFAAGQKINSALRDDHFKNVFVAGNTSTKLSNRWRHYEFK